MGAGYARVLRIAAERGADILEAVGRHRHAHSRSAYENAEIDIPQRHRLRDGIRMVGIVARLRRDASRIDELRVCELLDYLLFEAEASMI